MVRGYLERDGVQVERVASVPRRSTPAAAVAHPRVTMGSIAVTDGAIVLDPDARTVTVSGGSVSTTKREFDLPQFFLGNVTLETVWGQGGYRWDRST